MTLENLSRRQALAAGLVGAASLTFPAAAFAADAKGKRLVVIILRGGLDGLAAVSPLGDPNHVSARKGAAQPAEGTYRLNDTFALHPRLKGFADLYTAKELIAFHAVGTPYRDRSHFDGQNVLETGSARPFARGDGWLNQALLALPKERSAARAELAVALAQQAPLVLRGAAPVTSWSPSSMPDTDADTITRLMDLYSKRDPALAKTLSAAAEANAMVGMDAMGGAGGGRRAPGVSVMAKAAATFLKKPDGPVVAVLEGGGWDTHVGQMNQGGPLFRALGDLDLAITTLKAELGPVWANTAVLVVTEFGRTVAMNGAGGTDHGQGAAAFLAGGAVAGGRVIADFPGLAPAALYEGRDLRPTMDLRAIMKGVLADQLGVARAALDGAVFPDSSGVAPMQGLLRG